MQLNKKCSRKIAKIKFIKNVMLQSIIFSKTSKRVTTLQN